MRAFLPSLLVVSAAAARTGVNTPGQLAWKDARVGPGTSGGSIDNAAAAVHGDTVFFMSAYDRWTMFALDAKTGDHVWNFTNPGTTAATGPGVANGMVFFAEKSSSSGDNVQLRALHAKTGDTIWTQQLTGGAINDIPVPAPNGLVYVILGAAGSPSTDTFHAVNATTGAIVWSAPVKGTPSRPAFADGVVYASAPDGTSTSASDSGASTRSSHGKGAQWSSTTLHALDATTGAALWTKKDVANQWATPVIYEGILLTSMEETTFLGLDAKTGKQLWTASIDGYNGLAPALDGDGRVFLAGAMSSLYGFNASTGEKLWATQLNPGGHLWSVPTYASGSVYVGGDDAALHSVDAVTGKVNWKYNCGAGLAVGSPIVGTGLGDGLVYVGTNQPWAPGSAEQLFAVFA